MFEDPNYEARRKALADFLGDTPDEIEFALDSYNYDQQEFALGRRAYRVMTVEEADRAVYEAIRESLWAFNFGFIQSYIPAFRNAGTAVVEKPWGKFVNALCEDANPIILALVGDRFGELVSAAVGLDGRGHFLNTYDGHEHECNDFLVYRTA